MVGKKADAEEPNFNAMLAKLRDLDLSAFDISSKTAMFAEFPIEEYKLRYAKACRLMEDASLDALLVTQDLNVRYFAGYLTILWCSRFRPCVVLLPRDYSLGPTIITPRQETGNVLKTSWVADAVFYPDQDDPVPFIADAIREKGLKTGAIGSELGFGQRLGMNINQFESLKDALAPTQIVNGTPLIQAVRMVKSSREVECIRTACAISQGGVRAGWDALRVGMSEKELASIIGSAIYAQGAELGTQPSFFAVLAGPDRSQMGNALASEYRLTEGDLVLLDGGAIYRGYATDFIRQACIGEASADQKRWFALCVEANERCVDAIRPGATGVEVSDAGMAVFDREGLLAYNFLGIVGHGTGIEVHEPPWLGDRSVYTALTTLEPGMVLSVEPMIGGMDGAGWRAGSFIVEDQVLVTETGCEILTDSLGKELWVQPDSARSVGLNAHEPR